jgi:uncharacterized membrane protein
MKYFVATAIFIAIIWGTTPFLTKHVLRNIQYKSMIFVESLLAFIVSFLFCLYNKDEITEDLKNINCSTLCVIGLLTLTVFFINILYYNMIRDHETYIVSSITSIYPVIALALSYLFLKEEITSYKILGIFLVTTGILFIVK